MAHLRDATSIHQGILSSVLYLNCSASLKHLSRRAIIVFSVVLLVTQMAFYSTNNSNRNIHLG